mmetsp:Transcript_15217/g.38673  ORF Transcript_15217/g.38673 Transcript_15217/m.38673 type:complete len:216 (-) Transcript_15217:435-1082(-)
MDQFPTSFLLSIFLAFQFVATEILVKSAHQNHANHTGEEENDHQTVDDAEPVNLIVTHHQIDVPTRGPTNGTLLPVDTVGPYDGGFFLVRTNRLRALRGNTGFWEGIGVTGIVITMLDAIWADFKANNAKTIIVCFIGVIFDGDERVIVNVELAVLTSNLLAVLDTKLKAGLVDGFQFSISILKGVRSGGRKVVKNPVDTVFLVDTFRKKSKVFL